MIPVNQPSIGESELECVVSAVRSGWISSAGPYLDEFESRWAEYCGVRHGVAVSSGTAALDVALNCLDLAPGDEVILPTFTIISCVLAIIRNGARPVLVDCDPDTWCLDVDEVASKVTPRTKAIMAVHMYGHPAEMDALKQTARQHDLVLIEDAAEAHGAEYKGKRCGGLGDLAVFSFYANKIVTTGEGGMVVTNDQKWASKARAYRNLCFQPGRRFVHERLGQNYRMTNLQAALGVGQLDRLAAIVKRKRAIAASYTALLRGCQGLQLPMEKPWVKSTFWMYGVVLDDALSFDAAALASRLAGKGVETRPFFLGMHEQPVFQETGLFPRERFPVSERLARRGLYLPSGTALTDEEVQIVSEAVFECVG